MSDFKNLFDGKTLSGWKPIPRYPVPQIIGGGGIDETSERYRHILTSTATWTVEDGAITGRQDSPDTTLGGYLLSEETYGDFEFILEARPDWPADTGIMIRATDKGSQGFQILVDHRKSGNIGGVFGNGIGGFHAINFVIDITKDENGKPNGLRLETAEESIEMLTPEKRALLRGKCCGGEEFLAAWKWDDWNEFRIVVRGELPVITVYINGVFINELDTAEIDHPRYFPEEVKKLLGSRGHIAFEVHDLGKMGRARWGEGAACRWRNIRIREI